ncbi:MAG: hypothetical protein E7436_00160, partial [Ruminococcaceae bacterium]|nr:hypothetical protein [Oscillospiraceae bacterium]
MKKFVSCLLIVALLAGMLSVLPAVAASDETLSVRILNDFEESTRTEAHSAIVDTGAQANSFEAGGYKGSTGLRMYNDNDGWLKYLIYNYSYEQLDSTWRDEWQEAQYLQFYVRNEGPGVVNICISSLKKDSGAMDHWQEYDITEAAQFVTSTDGVTWTNLDKTLNGNGVYEIQIASGFEGFVRVAVNKDTLSFPDQGWGLFDGIAGRLQMTFGVKNTTVFVDDVALVGAFSDVVEGYQFDEAEYFKKPVQIPDEVVRILNDFEEATRTEAHSAITDTGAQANSFEAGGYKGSTGLKMYNDNDGWLKYNIYSYGYTELDGTWRDDWQEAQYLQFYVRNEGPGVVNICLSSLKKDNGAMDHWQEYDITEAAQFMTSADGVTWTNLNKTLNGNGLYEIQIASGFEGFVRVAVNKDTLSFPDQGWGLFDGIAGHMQMTFGVKNTTVFVDDVALVGNFTDTVEGYQYSLKDYLDKTEKPEEAEPTDPAPTDAPTEPAPAETKPDDDVRVIQ